MCVEDAFMKSYAAGEQVMTPDEYIAVIYRLTGYRGADVAFADTQSLLCLNGHQPSERSGLCNYNYRAKVAEARAKREASPNGVSVAERAARNPSGTTVAQHRPATPALPAGCVVGTESQYNSHMLRNNCGVPVVIFYCLTDTGRPMSGADGYHCVAQNRQRAAMYNAGSMIWILAPQPSEAPRANIVIPAGVTIDTQENVRNTAGAPWHSDIYFSWCAASSYQSGACRPDAFKAWRDAGSPRSAD
jgi:hypothetical protein